MRKVRTGKSAVLALRKAGRKKLPKTYLKSQIFIHTQWTSQICLVLHWSWVSFWGFTWELLTVWALLDLFSCCFHSAVPPSRSSHRQRFLLKYRMTRGCQALPHYKGSFFSIFLSAEVFEFLSKQIGKKQPTVGQSQSWSIWRAG